MELSKTWVIIPAYNEETTIGQVIDGLLKEGLANILVVDDGSADRTAEIARQKSATVISHLVNLGTGGAGAATATGLDFLRDTQLSNISAVITCDADGQHSAADVRSAAEVILNKEADLVIGSRILENKQQMPFVRLVGNLLLNILTRFFVGIKTSDSQSGLRALSKKALTVMQLRSNGVEFLTEMFQIAKQERLIYKEIPIQTIYTDYSLTKVRDLTYVLNVIRFMIVGRSTS
ncbi:glycosyltransferase family 2 protein [Patescibacteria group bacterium]|nr:glycosyltransferase family 2 protein [Patescibacteria group bacterium]MBU1868430.1 glycosyltransferase family 2 protein [Patescibacteria group bacterium]